MKARFKFINGLCVPESTPDDYFERAAEDWKRRQAIFASVAEGIQRKQAEELLFPEGPEAAGDRYLVWKGVKL